MIQLQIEKQDYWVSNFTLSNADIEQIYNHLIELERPQSNDSITKAVMAHRIAIAKNELRQTVSNCDIYQPQKSYSIGKELLFPFWNFQIAEIKNIRPGYNPTAGHFSVIQVEKNGTPYEFASELKTEHALNELDAQSIEKLLLSDVDTLYANFGAAVGEKIEASLHSREEFVSLQGVWFAKALLLEMNVGHMNIAEAVLDMYEGGPLPPEEILIHLDLPENSAPETERFSLNYALQKDNRFDEVAPRGEIGWYLRRMEPAAVHTVPERLVYHTQPESRRLLTPILLQIEKELDDEWSPLPKSKEIVPVTFTLTYPHRWAGTIPLSSHIHPLCHLGHTTQQRLLLTDPDHDTQITAWVVPEHRYICGLLDWYQTHKIPVGGYVTLKPGEKAGELFISYKKHKPRSEWIRLGINKDRQIDFEFEKRAISCHFDDLMVVGTDFIDDIDALWRRADKNGRSLQSLLAELIPALAAETHQNMVHLKTIYSAINMLRRVTPGAVCSALIEHPAFEPTMGEEYWRFNQEIWQQNKN